MKKPLDTLPAIFATGLLSGICSGVELLREEFDGYNAGTIIGQTGQPANTTGEWSGLLRGGSANIGPGLSGDNALVITSPTDRVTLNLAHTIPGWGTGQFWMSYLVNQPSQENAHMYVTAGESFSGAFGHAWSSLWGINNTSAPGNTPYIISETVRLVALIDFDAGTTAMWVNPDPNTTPVTDPLDPGFSPTSYKDSEAQGTSSVLRIDSYPDIIVDDIIVGSEYADVAIEVPDDPPVAPTPVNPTDAASSVDVDASLEWTANGATNYDVFLWKNGDTMPATPTVSTPIASYTPLEDFEPVTTYNWQVDSTNSGGTTTGAVWTFTTNDGVNPLLPPNGVSDVPLDIPFEWTDNGADSWDIYFWKDGETQPVTPVANVSSPEYISGGLDASTLYNWEIVSNYSAGSPTTSASWTFTTGTGVPGMLLLHEEFDGYSAGSIVGQFAKGLGLDSSSQWALQGTAGTAEIGAGLSGANGLIIDADGTGGFDAFAPHTVAGWGTGTFYMSFLWNETAFTGHLYVSGGGSFAGSVGHPWQQVWAVNNDGDAIPYLLEQTYRIVAKIDNDAGTVTMWVDPSYEFDNPVAFKSELQSTTTNLMFRSYGTDGTIDDIRIGTDFASVIQFIPNGDDAPTLSVVQNGANLDFSWNSSGGMLYDLLSATDLTTAPSTWDPVGSNTAIPADAGGTNLLSIPVPADPKRFYVVNAYSAPPATVFSADFEADNGGFAFVDGSDGSGTPWEWGAPDSDNGIGSSVTGGNGGSTNAWATGLGDVTGMTEDGFYNTSTDAALISPIIDLTGATEATLNFAQALDLDGGDTAVINFLDSDAADANVGSLSITDGDVDASPWETRSVPVPAGALGKNIKIEWRLTSGGIASDFIGWYIDDVSVTTP